MRDVLPQLNVQLSPHQPSPATHAHKKQDICHSTHTHTCHTCHTSLDVQPSLGLVAENGAFVRLPWGHTGSDHHGGVPSASAAAGEVGKKENKVVGSLGTSLLLCVTLFPCYDPSTVGDAC